MLGLTMRMERKNYPNGNSELRNAIACDWPRFISLAMPGRPYVLLPNIGADIVRMAEALKVTALIFSGGDDWGVFPQRDESEQALFLWAQKLSLPILGVCRGAQVINRLMGGYLKACPGHAGTRHGVLLRNDICPGSPVVNSFHGYGINADLLAPGLTAFACAPDGTVEGFVDKTGKIWGVMWHPERESAPTGLDLAILQKCFGGNY